MRGYLIGGYLVGGAIYQILRYRIFDYLFQRQIPIPTTRFAGSVCIPRNSSQLEYAKHVLREGEISLLPADMDVELEDLEETLVQKRSDRSNPFLRHGRDATVGCPEARSEASAPVAHRSLCPWQWIVSSDEDVSFWDSFSSSVLPSALPHQPSCLLAQKKGIANETFSWVFV